MSIITPYQEMWDRPLGGESSEKGIPHLVGNFFYVLVAALCKVCFRYTVKGREQLRAFNGKSGVVLVGNHTSFLDVAFNYIAVRPTQWVRFMGREDLFEKGGGLVGHILSRVGAFPVKRDSADRKAVKRATKMLRRKEVVGILPEGTRRGKGSKSPELHSGAAFVARMGRAPLLPYAVRNAEKVKQKGSFIRFPKVSIEYGTPLLVSDFDFLPKEERLEGCTWYVMRECFALFYECAAEEVNMVELFPDAQDFSQVFENFEIPERSIDELVDKLQVSNKGNDAA